MKHFPRVLICFLSISITFALTAYAQDNSNGSTDVKLEIDIEATTLLDKYIEAQGGYEAMAAITDISMEAVIVLEVEGVAYNGQVLLVSAAPNKMYTFMTFDVEGQNMTQENWCDGNSVTESGAFRNAVLEGEKLAAKLEENEFNSLLRMKELGYTLSITDKMIKDGTSCYYLEVQKKYDTSTWIIDAETFLRIGSIHVEETDAGKAETRIAYLHYESFEGMMVPTSWTISQGNVKTTISETSYSFNTNPPESTFVKN